MKVPDVRKMSKKQKKKLGIAPDARFDPNEAVRFKKMGLTYEQIAKVLTPDGEKPISPQSVHQSLHRLADRLGDEDRNILDRNYTVDKQKEMRKQLVEEKYIKALKSITPKKLKSDTAVENARTAKLLYDQMRLENNESTSNVAMNIAQVVEKVSRKGGL